MKRMNWPHRRRVPGQKTNVRSMPPISGTARTFVSIFTAGAVAQRLSAPAAAGAVRPNRRFDLWSACAQAGSESASRQGYQLNKYNDELTLLQNW